MGDKKDRLLREVAALRQLRGGPVNVLRGGRSADTTVADMLAALKQADEDVKGVVHGASPPSTTVVDAAVVIGSSVAMEVDGIRTTPSAASGAPTSPLGSGRMDGGGGGSGSGGKGYLDNLTCVVWEDWRVRLRAA